MIWGDAINGLFEFTGGAINLLNVVALRRDKRIAGVHWAPTAFFSVWGVWNLGYYPSLDQWFSFYGGLFIVWVNLLWIGHALYYSRNARATLRRAELVRLGSPLELTGALNNEAHLG